MTTTATRPTGSNLETGEPASRAARHAAEKAARDRNTKTAKRQAKAIRKAARRAARKAPNPYKTGDHVRYTYPDGTTFPGGKVTAVNGRDVHFEFSSGIDMMRDHSDPGLTKTSLI